MSNVFSFDDDEETPSFVDEPTETSASEDAPEAEEGESNNRPFIIGAIVLGVILLCTLIFGAIYALAIFPGQQAARLSAESTMEAVNTQAALAVAMTQEVMNYTPTLPPTETPTPVPTSTPVLVAPAATETPGAGVVTRDPNADATATMVALNTQLASSQLTVTAIPSAMATATALANTGFADEVGIPALFVGALLLVVVILLARRLRETPSRA
jgi:hypothetical protein